MRIRKLIIDGFGCLGEKVFEFEQGKPILIVEDNERGKSTFAAAICAAICGFPAERKSKNAITQKARFEPWRGDSYYISAEIEAGGEAYVVERDFARGRFQIRDARTGSDLTSNIGEDLSHIFFGVSLAGFRKAAFITGREAEGMDSGEIRTRLETVFESAPDASIERALKILDDVKYAPPGQPDVLPKTAVIRMEREVAQRREKLGRLEAELESASPDLDLLAQMQEEERALSERASRADAGYRYARLAELRERIADAQRCNSEISELENELKSLGDCGGFPAGKRPALDRYVGTLAGQEDELSRLRVSLAAIERESAAISQKLDSLQNFAGASDSGFTQLISSIDALRTLSDSIDIKKAEAEREKSALVAAGVDADEIPADARRLENLSAADREFIRKYRERGLELAAQLRDAELDKATRETERDSIIYGLKKRIAAARAVSFALAAIFGAIAYFFINNAAASAVAALLIIADASLEIAMRSKCRRFLSDLDPQIAQAAHRVESVSEDVSNSSGRLEHIAVSVGFDDPAALLDAFDRSLSADSRIAPLASIQAQIEHLNLQYAAAEDRLSMRLAALGAEPPPDDLIDFAENAKAKLAAYLSSSSALDESRRRRASAERDISDVSDRLADTRRRIYEILSEAGIAEDAEVGEGMALFAQAESRFKRYSEITNVLLPNFRQAAIADAELHRIQAEAARLEADLGGIDDSAGDTSDWETERDDVRKRLEHARSDIAETEKRLAYSASAYRNAYAPTQSELEPLERELARASLFQESISIARNALADVAQSSRRRWATALNERASEILAALNPDYDSLLFDENLRFTIRHKPTGRTLQANEVDSALSHGARDQVYLAARLAITLELSSQEPLPIILDDPFIAYDEERFGDGMRYILTGLAKTNQVFALTCQSLRHRIMLKNSDLSSRIQLVEI